MNTCQVAHDTHQHLARIDREEAFCDAVQSIIIEGGEFDSGHPDNILEALEIIIGDPKKFDEFCESMKDVDFNHVGCMIDNLAAGIGEQKAIKEAERREEAAAEAWLEARRYR